MLAMIDMDMGNLQSVRQAFERVGAPVQIVTRPEDIDGAIGVILPGVGAFGDGMASLRRKGLIDPLRRHALDRKKPLLGICIGMQLLAERGEEHGSHTGLGFIRGAVRRLNPAVAGYRVPNMGWCDVEAKAAGVLFRDVPERESFYFAHSYHVECADPHDVAASIEYGGRRVTAAVERGNLFGVQFHPEKSQDAGLGVLAAFVQHVRRVEGRNAA